MADQFETYITMEGDTVDLIAFERFGEHGAEPAIWLANPGLADLDPTLPAGLTIKIPVPAAKNRTSDQQNMWGTGE